MVEGMGIEDAVAAPDDRLLRAECAPCKTETRGEVVPIGTVGFRSPSDSGELHDSGRP